MVKFVGKGASMRSGFKLGITAAVAAAVSIGAAQAADYRVAAPIVEPVSPKWSGFYIGGHAGVAFRDEDSGDACDLIIDVSGDPGPNGESCKRGVIADTANSGPNPGESVRFVEVDGEAIAFFDTDSDDDNGLDYFVGAQAGYSWQFGKWVWGVEADVSILGLLDAEDDTTRFQYFHTVTGNTLDDFGGQGTITSNSIIDMLATFRGRAGVALGDEGQFLVYGTGGLALASVETSLGGVFFEGGTMPCNPCVFEGDDDEDELKFGLALGGGFEYAITDEIRFAVEYIGHFFEGQDEKLTFFANDGRTVTFEREGPDNVHTLKGKFNLRLTD
jgi:opacity protein-like surface antigen